MNVVLTVLVGLFLAPFLLRYLDREEYGLFTLVNEVLMWLNLTDLGFSGALKTLAAQLSGRPSEERLNVLASTAFFAQLVEAFLVLVLGTFCLLFFDEFFEIRPDLHADAMILVGLLVGRSFVLLITDVFSSLLVAHQQVHIDNIIKIVMLLVRTSLVVVLVMNGFGVVSLGVGAITAALIITQLAIWRTYRLLPSLTIRLRHVSWSSLKSLLGLGLWFSAKALAHLGIASSSNILTGKLLSVSMITSLSLTSRLYLISRKLLFQISRTLRPAFGQMIGEGRRDRSFLIFRQSFIIGSGLAAVIGACIISVNRYFVAWWVGDVHYAGGLVDILVCIHVLALFWNTQFMVILTSDKQMKEQTIARLAQFGIGIVASIYLGRSYGLAGIIGGMIVAAMATSCWYLPVLVCRKFDHSIRDFLFKDISRIVVFSAIVIAVGWNVRSVETIAGSLAATALRGGITCVSSAIVGWFILVNGDIREAALKKLRTIFRQVGYNGSAGT